MAYFCLCVSLMYSPCLTFQSELFLTILRTMPGSCLDLFDCGSMSEGDAFRFLLSNDVSFVTLATPVL